VWHTWRNSLKADKLKALRIYQPLLLALCVSALLHAILFGELHIALPSSNTPATVLEARIVLPKKAASAAPVLKAEPEPAPVKAPEAPPAKQAAPIVLPEPPPTPSENAPLAPAQLEPAPVAQAEPVAAPPAETIPVLSEPSVVDEPLVLNQNAYRYVEARYRVSTKIDGPAQGKSSIVFDLNDQDAYTLTWKTEPSGLVAMFVDDLVQTSTGKLTNRGLQPLHYEYRYGDKADKTHMASFDWATKKVALQNAKETKVVDLPDDTQDILSFMFQFMYVAPLEVMQMHIVTGKKLGDYQYVFEGEETINTTLGDLKTVHIGRTGDDGDSKAELWLAVEYQNLPVKIRKTEKNGKVYEFVVSQIVTTKPPPIMP
jgi:hypothetical protein